MDTRKPWWRASAALFAALGLCACQHRNHPLDEEAMARELRTLESLSAEGAFVCDELASGHLKPSFAAVHLRDLSIDAAKAQRALAKPSTSLLESHHAAARNLAQQVDATLRRMAVAQPDGPLLERERRGLLALKAELDSLEKTL